MRYNMVIAIATLMLTFYAAGANAQRARNETAEQNVRESQQYEALVCSNPGFRAKRIAQECGPVTDPQLHQSCVASFQCDTARKPVRFRKAPASETVR